MALGGVGCFSWQSRFIQLKVLHMGQPGLSLAAGRVPLMDCLLNAAWQAPHRRRTTPASVTPFQRGGEPRAPSLPGASAWQK